MREYVVLGEALAQHEVHMRETGGGDGIRDLGALEAALMRPQTGYYDDLLQEAAALWESMAQNHPFVDGNKRTAMSVVHTFLLINGVDFSPPDNVIWQWILGSYHDKSFSYRNIGAWLRENTESISWTSGDLTPNS